MPQFWQSIGWNYINSVWGLCLLWSVLPCGTFTYTMTFHWTSGCGKIIWQWMNTSWYGVTLFMLSSTIIGLEKLRRHWKRCCQSLCLQKMYRTSDLLYYAICIFISEIMYHWVGTGEDYNPRGFHMFPNGFIHPRWGMATCVVVGENTDTRNKEWRVQDCEKTAGYVCELPLGKLPC